MENLTHNQLIVGEMFHEATQKIVVILNNSMMSIDI